MCAVIVFRFFFFLSLVAFVLVCLCVCVCICESVYFCKSSSGWIWCYSVAAHSASCSLRARQRRKRRSFYGANENISSIYSFECTWIVAWIYQRRIFSSVVLSFYLLSVLCLLYTIVSLEYRLVAAAAAACVYMKRTMAIIHGISNSMDPGLNKCYFWNRFMPFSFCFFSSSFLLVQLCVRLSLCVRVCMCSYVARCSLFAEVV